MSRAWESLLYSFSHSFMVASDCFRCFSFVHPARWQDFVSPMSYLLLPGRVGGTGDRRSKGLASHCFFLTGCGTLGHDKIEHILCPNTVPRAFACNSSFILAA